MSDSLIKSVKSDYETWKSRGGDAAEIWLETAAKRRLQDWEVAAAGGSAEACFLLSQCFFYGYGVGKDPSTFYQLLRKSAESGLTEAQGLLGLFLECLYEEVGIEKDVEQAEKWYRKAAASGDKNAQETLEEFLKSKKLK